MATLQLSAHFWTLRDDVIIPDCDLGAFKYIYVYLGMFTTSDNEHLTI